MSQIKNFNEILTKENKINPLNEQVTNYLNEHDNNSDWDDSFGFEYFKSQQNFQQESDEIIVNKDNNQTNQTNQKILDWNSGNAINSTNSTNSPQYKHQFSIISSQNKTIRWRVAASSIEDQQQSEYLATLEWRLKNLRRNDSSRIPDSVYEKREFAEQLYRDNNIYEDDLDNENEEDILNESLLTNEISINLKEINHLNTKHSKFNQPTDFHQLSANNASNDYKWRFTFFNPFATCCGRKLNSKSNKLHRESYQSDTDSLSSTNSTISSHSSLSLQSKIIKKEVIGQSDQHNKKLHNFEIDTDKIQSNFLYPDQEQDLMDFK